MMNSDILITILFAVVIIAISITLHEFMHGFMAKALGDSTAEEAERLSLNPLKHIDPFATVLLPIVLLVIGLPPFGAAKPVPVNFSRLKYEEFGGALVGLVGPLTNLVLAIVGAVFYRALGVASMNDMGQLFLELFIAINIGFFIFNMIPFPPLDGSRVLYAFAPGPLQRLMEGIERFGLLAIGIFVIFLIPLISPMLTTINNWLINLIV